MLIVKHLLVVFSSGIIHCLIASLFAFNILSQTDCGNLDFENGNEQNWTKNGNVQLTNRQQVDYYGGFPLALSGDYAIKLGDKFSPVYTAPELSRISRTISVNQENKNLVYGYAIVLLGYPHTTEEASYVKLLITNAEGDTVPCTEYTVFAQSEVGNGFLESVNEPESNINNQCCYPIFYQPWKMSAIDLSPYIGQNLTITVTSDWCVFNVDWGYAYVDFFCYDDLFTKYYDCNTSSFFINAIEGFSDYLWSGPQILSGQGTSSISTSQDGTYNLTLSNPNPSCPDVNLIYDFSSQNSPKSVHSAFTFKNPICENELVNFTNLSTAIPPILNYFWDFGDGTQSTDVSPSHIYPSIGSYDVTLIIENQVSCFDTLIKQIKIDSILLLDIGTDLVHCDDEWLTIKINNPGTSNSFLWSTGETGKSIVTQNSGFYFVNSLDVCASSDTIRITEDPAFFGKIPNVFTPNFDVINNFYFIESQDVVKFNLEIVNRWGELVYATNNPEFQWDGNSKELPLKDGVYFYKLLYQLSCQDSPRNKNGFVTIVR